MERVFYHVCSEGLEKNLIFRNRKEFIMGMNYVAICAYKCNVKILCFCLMSNHFHFVIAGSFEECWKFANEYKGGCEGCVYFFGDYSKFCNYIFVKGKRRPCPPGKDCTVKIERKGYREKKE